MQSRFLKFFVSRLLGTIVDTLVLWVLARYVFFSYPGKYLAGPAISFEIAMLHNYVISYFWIWGKHIPIKVVTDFFTRLMLYNISSLLGFFIKMSFLLLFERLFRWNVIYCNIAALLIAGIVNFFLAELVVFKKLANQPGNDSKHTTIGY